MLSLSVLDIKQTNIHIKQNIAKNALRIYFSSYLCKIIHVVSLFRNQIHSESIYALFINTFLSIDFDRMASSLLLGIVLIYS